LLNQGRDFMKFALPVFSAFVVSATLAGCAGADTCRGPSRSIARGGLAGLGEAGVRDLIAFLTSAR